MLGLASAYACSPALEGARANVATHNFNHLIFGDLELALYCFEGRTILPGHLDDSADLSWR